MPNSIIFWDFNGIISYNNYWNQIENSNHHLYKYHQSIQELYTKELCENWMRGNSNAEKINEYIAQSVGVSYQELFGIFVGDCCNLDISLAILELAQKLQKDFICVLITDNMDNFDRFTIPNNPILKNSFDYISNSFNSKLLKTDKNGKIFLDICEQYNCNVKDCVLIDNSNKNCILFENLGGKSICTTGESQVILDVLDFFRSYNLAL